MPDKWSKTRPWRARINRDVETVVKFESVAPLVGAVDSFTVPQTISAGERMFATRKAADSFVAAWRADHGADIVTDVYRAT